MRFRPNARTTTMEPLSRLSVAHVAATFEATEAGEVYLESIREARDRAYAVVRKPDVCQRDADRANGALDVLEGLLEDGLAAHKRVREFDQ